MSYIKEKPSLDDEIVSKLPCISINETADHHLIGGQANLGSYWLATSPTFGRIVLKMFKSYQLKDFRREIEILTLDYPQHCQHFVQAFEIVTTVDRSPGIVFEYFEKGNCKTYLAKNSNYSNGLVAIWCNQLANAMSFLHDRSIIHQDIRPKNIFVADNTLSVKLGGFSLARKAGPTEEMSFMYPQIAEAFPYNAPEFLSRQYYSEVEYGFPADIYSLAITFGVLLSKRFVFSDVDTEKLKTKDFYYQLEYWKNKKRDFNPKEFELISICTQEDPASRPKMKGLLVLLNDWLGSGKLAIEIERLYLKETSKQREKEDYDSPSSEPRNEEPKFRDEDSDQEGFEEISPDCLKDAKDEMTILIVGETGVGKSMFINALANYISFKNIKEAGKNCHVLIRSQFISSDENGKHTKINNEPNVEIEKELIDNEMINKTGSHSVTQKPLCYELIYGSEGNKKMIRLIDTPGIGNTRGNNQEKTNTKEVIKCLAQFEEIDAILILMRSNEGTLSTSFKYCLGQLFNQFPTNARKNFLFGFTSARSTFFSHGDTCKILNNYLKTLKSKNKVNIKLSESNVFYFDSEPFCYLCAVQNGKKYTYCTVEDVNTSWKQSVKETFRLLGIVSKLPRHRVRETLMRYYVESVLMALAKLVLQKTKRLLHQREELRQAISRRKAFLQNDMVNREFFEEMEMYREEFKDKHFATICNADCCAKTATTTNNGNHSNVVTEGKICHNPCNDTDVSKCVIFHKVSRRCENCGCPPESHIRSNYEIRFHIKTVKNPNFQLENETREEAKRRLDKEIEDLKADFGTLNEEKKLLEEYSSDFALFTKKHGMQYNASFISYLDVQIEEATRTRDNKLVVDLTQYKENYEEKIKMIENVGAVKDRPVKTEKEIDKMIEDLCSRFPDIFEEIEYDYSIKEPETAPLPMAQIKLKENGWFARFFFG